MCQRMSAAELRAEVCDLSYAMGRLHAMTADDEEREVRLQPYLAELVQSERDLAEHGYELLAVSE